MQRNQFGTTLTIAILIAIPVFAQTTTMTIRVEYLPFFGSECGRYTFTQADAQFMDTVGRDWRDLTIRMPIQAGPHPINQPPYTPTVSVAINGVPVGNPVTIFNWGFCWDNLQTYEFHASSVLSGYNPHGTNNFTFYSTNGQAGGPPAELIFTIDLRTFAFTLPPAASDKLLIHKSRSNDTYPSLSQVPTTETERPRYRFRGKVSSNQGLSLEADVWLRVIDPADPSPYIPPALQGANDNKDLLPKGVLMTAGCADPTCRAQPGQPLQVRASPGGVVEVELEGTDRYAGDNYQLEAGFDPQFTCATAGPNGTNVCAKSGIVTAWKRVYIEKRRMLRNGLFLAWDAQAGDTYVITRGNHWRGNRGNHDELSKNEKIVIVHAPQLDRSDLNDGWYFETHTILSVQDLGNRQFRVNLGRKQGNTIIPEPLQHDYRVDVLGLADAISKLDSLAVTAADVFDAPMDLVTGEPFRDSFTENIILPDISTPGANVPVPFIETAEQPTLQALAEKWSSVVNGTLAPNHQLLIIGSDNNADGDGTDAGVTITFAAPDKTSSYVFWSTIDQQLNGNNSNDVNTWAKKTAAHEIAHQWKTNGAALQDHCPDTTKAWNDSSVYCLLAAFDPDGAGSVAQRMNGIARFHAPTSQNGWHSEYLKIRSRPDPFVP